MKVSDRPNILFVMADQLGRHMCGFGGNPVVRTPHLDKLASEGVVFDANYIQNPICMPSRASMFTGRYPSVCGTRINGVPLRETETTLPQALLQSGYRTFAAGKLHFRPQANSMYFEDGYHPEHEGTRPYYGFAEYHLSDDNRIGPYARWVEKYHPEHLEAVLKWPSRGGMLGNTWDCWKATYPPEIHQTNWVADRTIDFLRRQDGEKPFFAFCSFADPHHPFNPPEPYASMYDGVALPPLKVGKDEPDGFPKTWAQFRGKKGFIADYTAEDWDIVRRLAYGMTTLVDDAVGRVVAALEKSRLSENTIIVFTSDHGEMLGEHCLGYKGTFHFDEVIRTPLFYHWPRYWKAKRSESLSQSMDIMPTLLDTAGCAVPDAVQGASVRSILEGNDASGRERVLVENYCRAAMPEGSLIEDVNTLVTPEWKFTLRADRDVGQLFDRRNDPGELLNLWNDEKYARVKTWCMEELAIALSAAKEGDWRREAVW